MPLISGYVMQLFISVIWLAAFKIIWRVDENDKEVEEEEAWVELVDTMLHSEDRV